MSKYRQFDIEKLTTEPVNDRDSKLTVTDLLQPPKSRYARKTDDADMTALVSAMVLARRKSLPIIWFIGGHVIKRGLSLYLIEMMRRGWITLLAGNGSVMVHDFELAYHGATSEPVTKYLPDGKFGMWSSMMVLNTHIARAQHELQGLGEGVGSVIINTTYPYQKKSVLATAYAIDVPVTIHPMIGGDINHMLLKPGGAAALGSTAHRDFLIFAAQVSRLQQHGGVFINAGSAVHGPEVFLKALSMARNLDTKRKAITTAVFDIANKVENWAENDSNAAYYSRPHKTILNRAVEGPPKGSSLYIQGDHQDTIPDLWNLLNYHT